MNELKFVGGNDVVTIKIFDNKRIVYTSNLFGINNVPIEKIITVEGVIKEYPELKDLPKEEVLFEGVRRWKEIINKLESIDQVKNYVIAELEQQGLTYVGRRING